MIATGILAALTFLLLAPGSTASDRAPEQRVTASAHCSSPTASWTVETENSKAVVWKKLGTAFQRKNQIIKLAGCARDRGRVRFIWQQEATQTVDRLRSVSLKGTTVTLIISRKIDDDAKPFRLRRRTNLTTGHTTNECFQNSKPTRCKSA